MVLQATAQTATAGGTLVIGAADIYPISSAAAITADNGIRLPRGTDGQEIVLVNNNNLSRELAIHEDPVVSLCNIGGTLVGGGSRYTLRYAGGPRGGNWNFVGGLPQNPIYNAKEYRTVRTTLNNPTVASENGSTSDVLNGALSLGNSSAFTTINLGSDANAKTINVGNETGATALDLDAGTGGVTIDAQGAGTLNMGTQADTGAINIGTAASARTITVGNSTASTVVLVAEPLPTVGTGFDGAEVAAWNLRKRGTSSSQRVLEFLVDLTGLNSGTTDLDIIGEAATANCHFGQVTAAIFGEVTAVSILCLEVPAGGVTAIDLYSATEATGTEDTLVTDLTETAILTASGAWAVGDLEWSSAAPAANQYMYLASGAAGTDGTYTAGRLLITFYGT
jgi:hypothetical protein